MNDPYEPSYTVGEFCDAERLSPFMLYKAWKEGRGPRYYMNGRRRIITHRARLEWQASREAEVSDGSAA
jgi:hypothetical protein